MRSLPEIVGQWTDYRNLSYASIDNIISAHWILVRYDRQPMIFEFIFYRAKEKWAIYSFSYGEEVDELLQEKLRAGVTSN